MTTEELKEKKVVVKIIIKILYTGMIIILISSIIHNIIWTCSNLQSCEITLLEHIGRFMVKYLSDKIILIYPALVAIVIIIISATVFILEKSVTMKTGRFRKLIFVNVLSLIQVIYWAISSIISFWGTRWY